MNNEMMQEEPVQEQQSQRPAPTEATVPPAGPARPLSETRNDYLVAARSFTLAEESGHVRNATIESSVLGLLALIQDDTKFAELRGAYFAVFASELDMPGELDNFAEFVDVLKQAIAAIEEQYPEIFDQVLSNHGVGPDTVTVPSAIS